MVDEEKERFPVERDLVAWRNVGAESVAGDLATVRREIESLYRPISDEEAVIRVLRREVPRGRKPIGKLERVASERNALRG